MYADDSFCSLSFLTLLPYLFFSFVASANQKRQKDSQTGVSKKHKPNRKSLGVPPKKNRKTGMRSRGRIRNGSISPLQLLEFLFCLCCSPANSSDSEDQTVAEGVAKSAVSKNKPSEVKTAPSPKCHGRSPPTSHKYHKQGDADQNQHRDNHGRSPRVYKWSFQMCK